MPVIVAKSLDEWVERTIGKVTPICFSSLHQDNATVSSSAAVERVGLFSVGLDVLLPKRASLTAENFERLVLLLQENVKCPPSLCSFGNIIMFKFLSLRELRSGSWLVDICLYYYVLIFVFDCYIIAGSL